MSFIWSVRIPNIHTFDMFNEAVTDYLTPKHLGKRNIDRDAAADDEEEEEEQQNEEEEEQQNEEEEEQNEEEQEQQNEEQENNDNKTKVMCLLDNLWIVHKNKRKQKTCVYWTIFGLYIKNKRKQRLLLIKSTWIYLVWYLTVALC